MKYLNLNFALLFFTIFIQFIQVGLTQHLPEGWFRAGSHPENYMMGPGSSGYVKSIPSVEFPYSYGTLIQSFFPKAYLGKRVRLSGFVKSNNVTGWAGLLMRVDTLSKLYLDTMYRRPITGNNDWTVYEDVLEVPIIATKLTFGISLVGEGEVWLDECKFEIVDPTKVNLTELTAADGGVEASPNALQEPINLSF
ncbi:3015_t:CDS:2 [Funneliformis caledonium]|uniref:3015_t:CDS:1 n=1 Tax=Funneliformis caledonium TaxID=1117310 RepID=A0A9N9EXM9_9GLOM|nr:3015_t:CDS:2 [Funneliformis caledonium]